MKQFLVIVCITGLVLCQDEIPEDLQELTKKVSDLGLENFNQSNAIPVEEATDVVRKKCEKNGGEGAFDRLQNAKDELQTCVTNHFNFTQIQDEVEKAKSTGSMDEVFARYCAKREVVYDCVKNLTDIVESCLEEDEKENMKLILNVTDSLANFVCFKDGDRIAMFVAEGGVECLESKKEELQKCANETLGHRIPKEMDVNSLPKLLIDSQECSDFSKLQKCVVTELETCKDNTPANIVDALFKFIRRVTPCKNQPVHAEVVGARQFSGDANILGISLLYIVITAVFVRYF